MGRHDAINYEELLTKVANITGVGDWYQSTKKKIAEQANTSEITITRLFKDLATLGYFESRAISGGQRENGTPIRRQEYRLNADTQTIINATRQKRHKWGQAYNNGPKPKEREFKTWAAYLEPVVEQADGDFRTNTEQAAFEADTRGDSPFSALRPLRKDEAAALIEAARQYQDTMSFINEEISRFEARGIRLDPATIGFPRDPQLEALTPVIDYVSGLERRIERLQDKAMGGAEVGGLKEAIKVKEDTIRDLMRQRERTDEEIRRAANQWSGERATYNQRIELLEQENHSLRMLVANGANSNGQPVVDTFAAEHR